MKATESETTPQPIPPAEWVVAALGLVLSVVVLVSLLYQTFQGESSPPDIGVTILSTQRLQNGYVVEIRISNQGETPAAEVVIQGTLRPTMASEEESGQVTLDYIAGESHRQAGLFFRSDPRNGVLKVRAVGYHEP